ncbi:hypothetical protein BDA99DRAFT_133595 [Phascolomyces articulosus]|uniref:Uncharacterized protein n=1 Tax=Phascolomyces articulosus TaxID=60185 RepID=A0AAD5K9C9_9FUNG|nr:hypothetical protein BDA99DRAFT_133595 [Phascolomyces articulosus]
MHNPSSDEAYESQVRTIQTNITKYQTTLKEIQSKNNKNTTVAKPSKKEQELVRQLNTEFANLRKVRLERSQQYKERHGELPAVRKERQKQIQARQQEFEKELEEKEAKQKQKVTDNGMGACDELIHQLQLVLEPVEQLEIQDNKRHDDDDPADATTADSVGNGADQEHGNSNKQPDRIQVVNAPYEEDDEDTSLLIIPLSIMELFWDISIQVPVRVSEIEPTLARIRERRGELSSL